MQLSESSLNRVYQQTLKFDSGTITAYRSFHNCGDGDRITKQENKSRNKILINKLLKDGYSVTKIKGTYIENFKSDKEIEVSEESFLVVDILNKGTLKKDLISLGTEFDQDSITYAVSKGDYYLISTNTCPEGYPGFGKIGKEVKLGKAMFSKSGEFHSKVNGRPFVFESLIEPTKVITDFFPTEIRSIKETAKDTSFKKYFVNK